MLGAGTFGQVVRCKSLTETDAPCVAIKVLKNKPAYFRQGMLEVGILALVRATLCVVANEFVQMNEKYDPDGSYRTVRMVDHFICKSHLCIVFELLRYAVSNLEH